MKLFHPAQTVQQHRLWIPPAMQAALGWHSHSRLFWWSHLGDPDSPAENANQFALSAFLPNARELWHLSARFSDRPGMMAELAKLLTEENVDIVSCRASTELQNTAFSVEMDLDTSGYRSTFDYEWDRRRRLPERSLRELHSRIVATFIREIVFRPDGSPSLTINRNPILAGAIYPEGLRIETQIHEGGYVNIPRDVESAVTSHFVSAHNNVTKRKPQLLALVVADARWGVADVTFYYRNTGYRHMRVEAHDQVGTLQTITAELRDRDFNILQLYSRPVRGTGRGLMDMFIQSRRKRAGRDSDVARVLRAAFRDRPLRDLDPILEFPDAVTVALERSR